MVLQVGDIHYAGMGGGNSRLFKAAYHELFKSKQMRNLYENNNIAYTFDDHDTGRDDSDGTKNSTAEANLAYREVFPHYELAVTNSTKGI